MPKFLLFDIYGSMASWGDIAIGEIRRSNRHPTRSAICGLMGAALGIDRSDSEQLTRLSESICFGVKVYLTGKLLRDYHTIQTLKQTYVKSQLLNRRDELLSSRGEGIETILSTREYYNDTFYQIAIWESEYHPNKINYLEDLRYALLYPVFHVYLGRKSCTTSLPFFPQIVEKETLREAFLCYKELSPITGCKFKREKFIKEVNRTLIRSSHAQKALYYWEECRINGSECSGFEHTTRFTRRDEPRSRTRWQFGERYEYHTILPEQTLVEQSPDIGAITAEEV